MISIHAPHTGRDKIRYGRNRLRADFNPRAPYGARRITSVRAEHTYEISIHAPHTGRDSKNA